MRERVSPAQLEAALAKLPAWRLEGGALTREAKFSDFAASFSFLSRVALLAQRRDHHPDMQVSFDRVKLSLSTHSAGAITGLDVALAEEIEAFLAESRQSDGDGGANS